VRPAVLPSAPEPPEKPEEVLRAAYSLFDHGDLAEAEVRARRAIAVGAGGAGHFLLGSIYMNRGRLTDAERELETAVRMNPGDTEAVRRLSDVRRSKLEQGQ
jgi:Flp pilus assembly protein TadD